MLIFLKIYLCHAYKLHAYKNTFEGRTNTCTHIDVQLPGQRNTCFLLSPNACEFVCKFSLSACVTSFKVLVCLILLLNMSVILSQTNTCTCINLLHTHTYRCKAVQVHSTLIYRKQCVSTQN